jgi:hypothetical protein
MAWCQPALKTQVCDLAHSNAEEGTLEQDHMSNNCIHVGGHTKT